MRLRRAVPGDGGKLSIVGIATFLESFANDHDGDEVVRYLASDHSPDWYEQALAKPDNALWLAEEAAGSPVGYAMTAPAALPGTNAATDWELKRIYLLSRWHGGGTGSALYAACEAEARERGARRLALSVYEHNGRAQRFYQARGYREIGRWLFEGFAASEDLIYLKDLAG